MSYPDPLPRQRKQQWFNHSEVLPGIFMIEDKASERARSARIILARLATVSVQYPKPYTGPGWEILVDIPKPRYGYSTAYFNRLWPSVGNFFLRGSIAHPSRDKLIELVLLLLKEASS